MDVDEEHHIFGSLCCSFYGREVSNRFLLDEYKQSRARKVMVTALSELWGGSFVDACNNDIRGELEGV